MGRLLYAWTVLALVGGWEASAANLLARPDMEAKDCLGDPVGWEAKMLRGSFDGVSIVPFETADGPEGRRAKAVALRFPSANLYLRQHPLTLVPGEEYRMGAWVRTSGLGTNRVALTCWDSDWSGEIWSERFPADSAGKWVRIEWTGRMAGSGREGFSFAIAGTTGTGSVEISGVSLEPLSEKAVKLSRGVTPAPAKPMPTRIVPIDPLLARVSADHAEMTFYYPGDPEGGIAAARLTAAIDGRPARDAAFGPDHRAKVSFGRIDPGEHRVSVSVADARGVTCATNAYAVVARAPRPGGPSGRRLNNFVTELFAGPLRNGRTAFHCPKDGWVWISFETDAEDAEGRIDDSLVAVVHRRPSERRLETMRRLGAGDHVLHVRNATGGTLRIHAVKTLLSNAWTLSSEGVSLARYRNPYEYFRRYFFPSFNTVDPYSWHDDPGDRDRPDDGFYLERGMRIIVQLRMPCADGARTDAGAIYARLTGLQAAREGYDIEVDENGLHAHLGRRTRLEYAEALWRLQGERPRQAFHTDWCDAPAHVFDDRSTQTSEIASILNTGLGTGMLFPEVYSAPQTNLAYSLERGEGHFKRFVRSVKDFVPGAEDAVLFFFATYINLGGWCDYPNPETDIKFHYAHFIRTLATDPDFAGMIGGIALGGGQSGDEEVRRWFARCVRHYCVEGRTDDLAARYGFAHLPGIVRNCDFAAGLSGWDAAAAEGGGIAAERIGGYGCKVQCRKKVPNGTGDGVAVFTHSEKGPNVLSQDLSGLRPGRHYALTYCTADYDDVTARKGSRPAEAFSSTLEGAEELPELAFVHESGNGGKNGTRRIQLLIHRQVFKATSDRARLVFTDWKSPRESGAANGVRRVLNYIIFRPYYAEGDEDVAFLRKIFRNRR